MSKLVKNLLAEELRIRFAPSDGALWIDTTGVDGITSNLLRRELRSKNMRAEVVKNSMFRRAVAGGRLSPLAERLVGPATLVVGESLPEVARVIESWIAKAPAIKLRGAVLEGDYLDERAVVGLSKLPSKREVQGQVVAAALSPGAKLAAAMLAPGANLAGCLRALIEKLEKAEAGPAAA